MWVRELTAPREIVTGQGGAVSASAIRVRRELPRRKSSRDNNRATAGHPQARTQEVGGVWTPR